MAMMTDTLDEQRKKDAATADAQAAANREQRKSEAEEAAKARENAAKKLRGSMGDSTKRPVVGGPGRSPTGGAKPAEAATPAPVMSADSIKKVLTPTPNKYVQTAKYDFVTYDDTPAGRRAKAADQAKKGGGAAKPKKIVSKSAKRVGSAGAASNKDLPGRTTIKYAETKKRDPAALRAGSKKRFEEQKKIGAARRSSGGGGSDNVLRGKPSRWNSQNRNK